MSGALPITTRHHIRPPMDLGSDAPLRDTITVEAQAIINAGATRTVVAYEGVNATRILNMLGLSA